MIKNIVPLLILFLLALFIPWSIILYIDNRDIKQQMQQFIYVEEELHRNQRALELIKLNLPAIIPPQEGPEV